MLGEHCTLPATVAAVLPTYRGDLRASPVWLSLAGAGTSGVRWTSKKAPASWTRARTSGSFLLRASWEQRGFQSSGAARPRARSRAPARKNSGNSSLFPSELELLIFRKGSSQVRSRACARGAVAHKGSTVPHGYSRGAGTWGKTTAGSCRMRLFAAACGRLCRPPPYSLRSTLYTSGAMGSTTRKPRRLIPSQGSFLYRYAARVQPATSQ